MFNEIKTRQYDSLDFDVVLTQNNTTYSLKTEENLWFTVKDSPTDKDALIEETQHDTHFSFDSIELSPGTYFLEVGIILEDGKTKTLIPSEDMPHPRFVVGVREKGADE